MKYFSLILALFFAIKVNAQSKELGRNEMQIRADLSNIVFSTSYTEDGKTKILSNQFDPSNQVDLLLGKISFYIPDNLGYCNLSVFLVPDHEVLNVLVKGLNKNSIVISDTEWKDYSEYGIMKIELHMGEGYPFFTYKLIK